MRRQQRGGAASGSKNYHSLTGTVRDKNLFQNYDWQEIKLHYCRNNRLSMGRVQLTVVPVADEPCASASVCTCMHGGEESCVLPSRWLLGSVSPKRLNVWPICIIPDSIGFIEWGPEISWAF